jgi:hypothetical protein
MHNPTSSAYILYLINSWYTATYFRICSRIVSNEQWKLLECGAYLFNFFIVTDGKTNAKCGVLLAFGLTQNY